MNEKAFVDTNVFVYSRDESAGDKQRKAAFLLEKLWTDRSGRISAQVCNEYYVTVTRKLNPGMSEDDAFEDIETLFAWDPLPISVEVIRKSRECQLKYHLSWWDSLIVASAYLCGCSKIFSEDLSHGQSYFGIEVNNPFL